MIFEVSIAAGAIYAGVRAYQQQLQKPSLGKMLATTEHQPAEHPVFPNPANSWGEMIQSWMSPQLAADPDPSALPATPVMDDQQLNRLITISTTGLTLAAGGTLVYPPLTLLSVPFLVYAVYPFVQRGYQAIVRERTVNMAVVDLIVLPGMILTGFFVAAGLGMTLFFWSRKLLAQTEEQSKQSLVNVFGEQPQSVCILIDGTEVEIPFEQLKAGDTVLVHAGEMIPTDGTVIDGMASVDQHMLTGESQPVEKEPGDPVFASTMLISGRITLTVERAGQDTVAARIGEILQRTADSRLSIQSRGERVADISAPPTLALGVVALPLLGVSSFLAVLFSSLGYNMRIIAPLSLLNYLQITSRSGILIKDGRSLELLKRVDTVVFDKTGTLTQEQPNVRRIYAWNGYREETLLTYAAAAEYKQTHPIARAILEKARADMLTLPKIEDAHYEIGYGIKVRIDGRLIRVGSDRFMSKEGIDLIEQVAELEEKCHAEGHSLVLVAVDDALAGAIELQPTVRPEAATIIQQLHAAGVQTVIISGDQQEPTRKLAHHLGIDAYFANTLPEHKAEIIKQLQAEGRSVCFVGDGINDSIALKQANVSVSMRGATTIVTDTAQVVLMDGSLSQLTHLFELARDFDQNMQMNLMTTLVPGVICIGGVFFFHFGVLTSVVIYNVGLAAGVTNAMLPMVRYQLTD